MTQLSRLASSSIRAVDTVLDRGVALGYSRVGIAVRRRLPGWPADLAPGALAGKRVAVTGATSGLGEQTVADLAGLGADVAMIVRDRARAEQYADRLRRETGTDPSVWSCDLGDLDAVAACADSLVDAGFDLDALVHNAGVLPAERVESVQGHELTMAVHVLAPVLLTERLLPILSGRSGRVVLVTSGGMYAQRLRADDPEFGDGSYSGVTAYARSKRAQVELLEVLQQRWSRAGVAVYATHPGWVDTPGVARSLPGFRRLTRPILRTAADGADTTVWLLGTEPRPVGGTLWHDRRPRPATWFGLNLATPEDRAAMWSWVSSTLELPVAGR